MQAWWTWQLADLSISTASRAGEVHQLWGSDASGKLATHTLQTAVYSAPVSNIVPWMYPRLALQASFRRLLSFVDFIQVICCASSIRSGAIPSCSFPKRGEVVSQ